MGKTKNKTKLSYLKKNINEAYLRLSNIPKFRPIKAYGVKITSQGLKRYSFIQSPEEQRKGYIENEVCRALMITLETPSKIRKDNLKQLYRLFSEDKEIITQLKVISKYNRQLTKDL